MIRTFIADGKERIENGKEQLQQKQAEADTKTEATESEAKVDSQQEALFDPSADNPNGAAKKN